MRTGTSFAVSPTDRQRLRALTRGSHAPQKHVWPADIILLSADDVGTAEIMRQKGKSKTCVWRWQDRFAAEGFEGRMVKRRPLAHPLLFVLSMVAIGRTSGSTGQEAVTEPHEERRRQH